MALARRGGGPFPGAHSVAVDGHGNIEVLDTVESVVRLVAAASGTFYGQPVTAGHVYVVAGRGAGSPKAPTGCGTPPWPGRPRNLVAKAPTVAAPQP